MKIIAIEEHVLPAYIQRAWNTIPGADDGTLGLNPGIIGERLADLGEQRLALMDQTGVDVQVLSLTTPGLCSRCVRITSISTLPISRAPDRAATLRKSFNVSISEALAV